eukprot:scaffold1482_cov120-Cylindrotheca_fusiformis.AAC.2
MTTRYHQHSHANLRILCLHDDESNALELSDSLEVLGERLYEKYGIDLVYVNSPLISRQSVLAGQKHDELPNRVWWEEKEEDDPTSKDREEQDNNNSTNSPSHNKRFVGLDASLLLLKQIWNSMPFWGILAIGKGAALGSLLPLMGLPTDPSFCCFVHGESLLDEEELMIDNLPCLHIVGDNPGPSERLIKQFGGQLHRGGKKLNKSILNSIGKFIVAQKKRLRENQVDTNILALQNQLYMVEQEAANVVAQTIAADPPKALMAVISPENVGGWSGRKRRGPKEEGGGAPCPPDFLLKREKRTTNPNGPTRQHPQQQNPEQVPEQTEDGE